MASSFHVAIVGGGMCGLACAAYLGRAGVKVDVFESASGFREIGAGIWLGPNALRVLEDMGLMEAIIAHAEHAAPALRSFTFVSAMTGHQHIHKYQLQPEDLALGVHRAAFLDALAELVDPASVHFKKRCISVGQVNARRPVIHFEDGTSFETDVVIGTDGIKSVVRKAVLGKAEGFGVSYTKTVAHRVLFPLSEVRRAGVQTDLTFDPHCFVGVDKHVVTVPINSGKILSVVIFTTDRSSSPAEQPAEQWVTQVPRDEVLGAFADCGPDVQRLLSLLADTCGRWAIHAVDPPLASFVKGRVALVGDAAHGMCPHLGAALGQGLEDALVLCRLLVHPRTDTSNIQSVLRIYDRVRQSRANTVLHRSAWAGEVYESLPLDGDGQASRFERLREDLAVLWEPVWHHDHRRDVDAALSMLESENGCERVAPRCGD